MRLLNRALCTLGVHHRSRRAAIDYPDACRSVCRTCRVPMIKEANGWRVDKGPIPALPPSPFA